MLGTDRQADRVRLDACIEKFFLGELGVCRGSRMDNKGLHVGNVCQKGEQFKALCELLCFFGIALQFKGEDRTCAVREVTVVECFLRRRRNRRVVYVLDICVILQEFNDLESI